MVSLRAGAQAELQSPSRHAVRAWLPWHCDCHLSLRTEEAQEAAV